MADYDEFEEDIEELEIEDEEVSQTRLERLVGPIGSLILHIIILVCLALFVRFVVYPPNTHVRAEVQEVNVKEIEKIEEIVEEIQELDDEPLSDMVPNDAPMNNAIGESAESEEMAESATDVDLEMVSEMSDVVSPVTLTGLFANRSKAGRLGSLNRYGGGRGTENAVLRALNWLKRNQLDSGTWPQGSPTAMAGLGVLAFLAHGETASSKEYGKTVQKALDFVRNALQDSGRFSPKDGHDYTHGIATYAICEAYAMTKHPSLRDAMEKSVGVIVDGVIYKRFAPDGSMRPVSGLDSGGSEMVTGGFFDYNLKNGAYPGGYKANYLAADGNYMKPIYSNSARTDNSFAGFTMQALKAAKVAGCSNPKLNEVIEACINGIKFMQHQAESKSKGYFAYSSSSNVPHKGGAKDNQLGVGAYTMQLFDGNKSPEAQMSSMAIYERGFDPGQGNKHGFYRLYYDANAAFWFQGEVWNKYNGVMKKWLPEKQDKSGDPKLDGSWSQKSIGSVDDNGLVYPTCLGALSLMVYYRNLPGSISEGGTGRKKPVQVSKVKDIKVDVDDSKVDLDNVNLDDLKLDF